MSRFGKVALLLGGKSPEREVSLMSGREVGAALRRIGYDVVEFDTGERPVCDIRGEGIDAAFIILHGGSGENGVIQGVLGECGIPYTGSGHCACALAMDKHYSKMIWRSSGIPTPPHCLLKAADAKGLEEAADTLGFPMFIKPRKGGSSVATARIDAVSGFADAVRNILALGDDAMAEPCISGSEITFSILGERVLPSIRIATDNAFYDYEAKYLSDKTSYVCPSGLDDGTEKKLGAMSLEAYRLLECAGWGRTDLMLEEDGTVHVLEVNTVPGMTTHSLVPMAAKAVGIGFDELVGTIMEDAQVTR